MERAIIKVCTKCYGSTEVRKVFIRDVRRWSKEDFPMRWWLNSIWKNSLDLLQHTRAKKAFHVLERAKCEGHSPSGKRLGSRKKSLWRTLNVILRSSSFIMWWWSQERVLSRAAVGSVFLFQQGHGAWKGNEREDAGGKETKQEATASTLWRRESGLGKWRAGNGQGKWIWKTFRNSMVCRIIFMAHIVVFSPIFCFIFPSVFRWHDSLALGLLEDRNECLSKGNSCYSLEIAICTVLTMWQVYSQIRIFDLWLADML